MNSPDDFAISVTNAFGTRTIGSNFASTLTEAQGVANQIIGDVDSNLATLAGEADKLLVIAQEAITALSKFSPTPVAVHYQPPQFTGTSVQSLTPLILDQPQDDPAYVSPGEVTMSVVSLTPTYTAVEPALIDFAFSPAPVPGALTTPDYPVLPTVDDPGNITLPPAMPLAIDTPRVFSLVDFVAPPTPGVSLAEYPYADPTQTGNVDAPEQVPAVAVSLYYYDASGAKVYLTQGTGHAVTEINVGQPGSLFDDIPLLIVPPLRVGARLAARELAGGTAPYTLRGIALPDDVAAAQTAYFADQTAMLNAEEGLVEYTAGAKFGMAVELAAGTLRHRMEQEAFADATALLQKRFEAHTLSADIHVQMVEAMVRLYNVRIDEFRYLFERFNQQNWVELLKLEDYKAELAKAQGIAKSNEQRARLYGIDAETKVVAATVFGAEMEGRKAEAQRYVATVQAQIPIAEVAKLAITQYRAGIEAFAARLSTYKAQMEAYSTTTKAVTAQNAAQADVAEKSMADMEAAGSDALLKATTMDTQAEQLKAEATQAVSVAENVKLANMAEAIRVQAQGDVGRLAAMQWASQKELVNPLNEGVSAFARQASTYYTTASNSAQHAADAALRAVTSATQAAAMAQEAAGRAGAAVASGAYSAAHVSAHLRGSGSIHGDEKRGGQTTRKFSDMLTYREQVSRTAGV